MERRIIDRNGIYNLRHRYEDFYEIFKRTHQELLNILEDADCIPTENFDKLYSTLKEYEGDLDKFESMFMILSSNNNKIKSLYNETRLLKKKRVATLQSNMERVYDEVDEEEIFDNLPF